MAALPATYDFQYYRGDSLTFYLRPEDNEGNPLNISAYTAAFTIATSRGHNPSFSIQADASCAGNIVTCTISSTTGEQLDDATQYVYDIELRVPPNIVKTYLTGTIYVTAGVSGE